jgi:hypothetical protein
MNPLTLNAAIFLLVAFGFVLWIASMVWVYRDAVARGKSGLLIAFLTTIIAWPWGVLIWLAARPHLQTFNTIPRAVDTDCPQCGILIRAGSSACSNCSYQHQQPVKRS